MLPIALTPSGGMTLGLTFIDTAADCCDTSTEYDAKWNVSNLAVHYDAVTVDSAFLTSISEHMRSAGSLQMQFKNYSTQF